ncbi:MBL fold metallo-hydrolase (plasmid) [Streptomyces sp. P9-2B-2]|uniref:MBL fold metallo-hydrolase n=1 Tax=Streptomyces sp. P9-2B-2 TaxID=3057114 RepID=UPI0025B2B72D|nr:MBL fold metallo-hydrolase [Streptomyces sp. P9-2B-2]WJY43270.1 MBL fold metallo-hydrolase [Streptomyces sp. P9-2B-2]
MTDRSLTLTFLGHQTWLVEGDGHWILVDPVLGRGFGLSPELEFRIWPPRTVETARMPQLDALVLTHEHLDHFHLPTLAALPKSLPVYTGPLLPAPVAEAIESLGFTVRRIDHTGVIQFGELTMRLYPAGARTLFWEDRVVQPVARVGDGPPVVIGVDADLSDVYKDAVASGREPMPRMAIVSNNSQIAPPGTPGSDTNLLPGTGDIRGRKSGLKVLGELLLDYLEPLPGIRDVALCGNGFLPANTPHGPYLYADHPAMAQAANILQHLFTVHGPRPGDQLTVPGDGPVTSERVDWVHIDERFEAQQLAAHEAFLAEPKAPPIAPIAPPITDGGSALIELDEELPRLARELVPTSAGQLAASIPEYLDGQPLGPHRILLVLRDLPGGWERRYAWDLTTARFTLVDPLDLDEAMARYPFGLIMFFQDLIGILRGQVQIWDVAGSSMQCWNIGRPLDSLVYALFAIYGEHQRPELAARSYAYALGHLAGARRAG